MPRRKPAAAGDTGGLERVERRQKSLDAGEMRAVGAATGHDVRMAVEQQRDALVLHERRQRLDEIDLRALVGFGEPQQHRRDVGGIERSRKFARECRRVLDLAG